MKSLLQDSWSSILSGLYPNGEDCTWNLEVEQQYRIELEFELFDVEPSHKCIYDYVNITNSDGRFIGR